MRKNNRRQFRPAPAQDALTAEYRSRMIEPMPRARPRIEEIMKVIMAIAALLFAAPASAADYKPLQGTYMVGGATLIDPPESEPQDTHFYVDVEGNAARDLYKALKGKAESSVCGEPGDLTKG